MIHFVVNATGASALDEYFALEPPELVRRFRVLAYEDLSRRTAFDRGTYVFSAIDKLSPGMVHLAAVLHERLASVPGVRLLNHPGRYVGRFDLLRQLHADGGNDFRAFRPDDDLREMRYPVFLRGERSHDGNLSPLLNSLPEVERAVGLALVQGNTVEDLMLTEFCSTVDPDGLYRKYAAYKVGDRIQARCLYHSPNWMVKFGESVYTRALVEEERDYVRNNPHADQLRRIFDLANVGYGQVDYSFRNGRLQAWEINVHPTIGRGAGPDGGAGPKELRPLRAETREYFFDWFREAWAAVDEPIDSGPAVPVQFDPEVVRAATPSVNRRQQLLNRLRALLRPVKPLIAPITGPLLRGLGVLVRRRQSRPRSR